jgi:hypothetical protein
VNTSANSVNYDRLGRSMVVESLIPSINGSEPLHMLDRDLDNLNGRERTHGRLELTNQRVQLCPHRRGLWLG